MSILPSSQSSSLLDWIDDVPPNIKSELKSRYDELTALQQEQVQMGTAVPQLYGSLSRFVANPSTVSVETYKRMLDTDDTIGAGIDFMNLSFISRFGEYKHPSKEIQEFVRRALNQMEGSWHGNLDEMFSAEWSGFSLTEQVWDFKSDFDGFPAFVPKKLVTYPPLTIVFAVNRHGEVLPDGIYQYQRFHNTFFNSFVSGTDNGSLDGFRPDLYASIGDYPYPIRIAADLTYLTVKIPKTKVIHLRSSSTGKFDNPYGRSILRRAYKHWVSKDAYIKMRLVAADRKGTPLLVGYAAPNDTVLQNEMNTGHGGTEAMRADLALAATMRTIHNSSFIVIPGRKGETYELEAIQTQGDMTVFKDAIDDCNKGILQSLLIPELIMGGSNGGSYALGSEHTKNYNRIIDGKLKQYKQAILEQFIQKIIAYNFPRKQWEKDGFGDFLLEEYDPDTMEKMANIFGALTQNGYLSPSEQVDMDHVREKFDLPKGLAVQDAAPEQGLINLPNNEDESDKNTKDKKIDSEGPTAGKNPSFEGEDPLPPNYHV